MDEGADSHAQQDVREHLLERAPGLLAGVGQALGHGHGQKLGVRRRVAAHEVGQVSLHAHFLDDGAAGDGDEQAHHRVGHGHTRTEDAHDQHQAAQVHHGRADEEAERDAQRQARAGEPDEQRDGAAAAKRRHSSQQRSYHVAPDTLETAHYLAAALRREVALDVADGEDEHAQQDDDLHRVIDEEVERAAPLARCVNAERAQQGGDQFAQPLHLQHLVQDEHSDGFHWRSFHIDVSIYIYV